MKFLRPRSLNGLILVGFSLVALPLLLAVVWALFNLDRVAEQSESLVHTGVEAADNNRRINERLISLERSARLFQVLKTDDSLQLITQNLQRFESTLQDMAPLVQEVDATGLAASSLPFHATWYLPAGRSLFSIVRTRRPAVSKRRGASR